MHGVGYHRYKNLSARHRCDRKKGRVKPFLLVRSTPFRLPATSAYRQIATTAPLLALIGKHNSAGGSLDSVGSLDSSVKRIVYAVISPLGEGCCAETK